ncbi:MAG: hypothetical protein EA377_09390 [Phycisphaerales bacterium]|nr:MAG: hypothetical protein EA377_09390 [Phycisphaerales bacterium]
MPILILLLSGVLGIPAATASDNFAPIPPLTDEQQIRLESAHDGRDYREEAFCALVESARTWEAARVLTHFPRAPDLEAWIADPDEHRGTIARIRGRLEQRVSLEPSYDVAEEWFVRDEAGTPLIVYVVGDVPAEVREGRPVDLNARFYKRMRFTARDGREYDYAAFVGAHPRTVTPTGALQQLGIVVIPLALLLLAFFLLLIYVRSQRANRTPLPRPARTDEIESLDEGGPLPDDPAEALAELRRRAQQSSR